MTKCSGCGSTIVFGGKKVGGYLFCNDTCFQGNALSQVMLKVPDEVVQKCCSEVHQGLCPSCNGPGPVDVYTSYRVWSALVLTSWSTRPKVSCKGCGDKQRLADLAISMCCGWWGFPWGVILTPVQVTRNIAGFFKNPDPAFPSKELETMIRTNIAVQALEDRRPKEDAPPPGATR